MNSAPYADDEAHVIVSRSQALADACVQLRRDLLHVREENGVTVETVAERMGVPVEFVRALERYDSNQTLSTLRRYALAVGAHLDFRVTNEEGA